MVQGVVWRLDEPQLQVMVATLIYAEGRRRRNLRHGIHPSSLNRSPGESKYSASELKT
jgi:hypothetical protein